MYVCTYVRPEPVDGWMMQRRKRNTKLARKGKTPKKRQKTAKPALWNSWRSFGGPSATFLEHLANIPPNWPGCKLTALSLSLSSLSLSSSPGENRVAVLFLPSFPPSFLPSCKRTMPVDNGVIWRQTQPNQPQEPKMTRTPTYSLTRCQNPISLLPSW